MKVKNETDATKSLIAGTRTPYVAPQLEALGSVADLVKGSGTQTNEGNMTGMAMV